MSQSVSQLTEYRAAASQLKMSRLCGITIPTQQFITLILTCLVREINHKHYKYVNDG